MRSDGRSRRRLTRRTLYLLSAAATVLVLAGVILGISALSSPTRSADSVVEFSTGDESTSLYEQALKALASNDETAAVILLQKAIALDSTNTAARDELTKIVGARASEQSKSGNDSEDVGATDPPDGPVGNPDEGFTEAVEDLGTLLPASLEGYEFGMVTEFGSDANVSADPTDSGPVDVITRVLFSVHDLQDPDTAKSFITSVTKVAFPENSAEVTVNGVPAYFGTDGARFATVAFSRGRFVFEVIVTTDSGAPGTLLDLSIVVASAFPDSQ